MADRLRVALVFGGRSDEHDVSVVSARSVSRALAGGRHEVLPMAIDRKGRWADAETAHRVLADSADRADRVVAFEGTLGVDPRLLDGSVDVVMPVLHGPYGEDGTIQGMLEMLDLPYVGSDTTASALCMSKVHTKSLVAHAGLRTPEWVAIGLRDWRESAASVRGRCLELGLPLFVKPARLGSSVGISKVSEPGELDSAIELALRHDELILVERGMDCREIEVAVLGNLEPRASLPGEIIPGHEFYDYEDKYIDDSSQLLAPAPLEETQREAAQRLAMEVYSLLGCEGMARVDLFLERPTGLLWVNEVNTIPGFTPISMYPMLWDRSGLPYDRLVDELIRLGLERHARRREST